MTIAIALSLSLGTIATCLLLQLKQRAWRKRRFRHLELRPNCLLTRYPIVFINGHRSLFRLFSHWNDIPLYLREHGYDVLVIDPAAGSKRADSLLAAIETFETGCHVIGDVSVENDLRILAENKNPKAISLTLVQSRLRENLSRAISSSTQQARSLSPDDLKPTGQAIEIFEVDAEPLSLARQKLINSIAVFLVQAHNFLSKRLSPPVHPLETGDLVCADGWGLEARFLDLAISLAERDAQWCD